MAEQRLMSEEAVKRPLNRLTRVALIASLAVAVLAGATFFLTLMTTGDAFVQGKVSGVYWLYANKEQTISLLIFMTCGALWFALMLPGVIVEGIALLERMLLTMGVAVVCIALLTLMGPSIGDQRIEYVQHTDLKTDQAVYRSGGVLTTNTMAGIAAALHDSPEPEPVYAYSFRPLVFRCDRWGIICHTTYQGADTPKSDEPPLSTLRSDGSTINLVIDGQTVWTHPEK
jgi:hypothetical protein